MLPLQTALAGAVTALAPVTEADGRLGFCDVLPGNAPNGTPWAQLAYNAGARVNRWEFRWDRIEPHPGQWNFTAADADVASSRRYGLTVEGVIDGIPKWAVAAHQPPGNGVPRGLRRPVAGGANLWAAFLRDLVSHYAGQVAYWEIWNEPDLAFFWNGTPDDYFRLLRVAYTTIKAVDPAAEVVMAGMVVPDMSFLTRVLADAQRASHSGRPGPFDIAAWHAYGPAPALYTNLLRLRSLLAASGFGLSPVWVTEDGFPTSNPTGEPRQAAYIIQTIAYAFAAGADKLLVYRASDDPLPKTWGVVSAAGVLRQGYVAFQNAARYFSHVQQITYAPTSHLERFELYEGSRRITLLWNHSLRDRAVSLTAGSSSGTLVDWSGSESPISASGSSFGLTVPGATYNSGVDPAGSVVGGPPVMVVEDNAAPAGLPLASYVAPISGARRTLLILNPSSNPVTAQVSASDPNERELFLLAPHGVAAVDLDLLAGEAYSGMYSVQSDGVLVAEAASDRATAATVHPSADWYLASAPPAIALSTSENYSAIVTIVRYGQRGKILQRATLHLGPRAGVTWSPRSSPLQRRTSLVVHASSPIVLTGPGGSAARAVPGTQLTWYVMRPQNARLVVFNPQSTMSHVDVRFVGASTVKGEQLRLAPYHSYVLSAHDARAVVLAASAGVALGYSSKAQSIAPLLAQPAMQTGAAEAGRTTHIDVFNPATQSAHVSITLVTGRDTRIVTKTLRPSQLYSFQARRQGGPPAGVLVNSDVAVVAVAAP